MHSTEKSGQVHSHHCLLLPQTELRLPAHIQFHSLLQNTSPPYTQLSVNFSPHTDFKLPACTVMENTLLPHPPPNTCWPNQTFWAKRINPTKTRCNFQGSGKGDYKVKKAAFHLTLLVPFLAGLDLPAAENGSFEESHIGSARVPVHYCSYLCNRYLVLSHISTVLVWRGWGLGGGTTWGTSDGIWEGGGDGGVLLFNSK